MNAPRLLVRVCKVRFHLPLGRAGTATSLLASRKWTSPLWRDGKQRTGFGAPTGEAQ